MVWKPKEKELTPEEAIALARRELTPYWFNSPPLIGGVPAEGGAKAVPLDPSIQKNSWLLAFLDPSEYSCEASIFYLREFHRRYQPHALELIVILKPAFPTVSEPRVMEQFLRKNRVTFPVAVDHEGWLARSFNASQCPDVSLISEGRRIGGAKGQEWMTPVENLIHKHLRSLDPGLALPLHFDPEQPSFEDTHRIELGSEKPDPRVQLKGKWTTEPGRISTSDPQAAIELSSPSECVAVLAQSLAKTTESAKIVVEVDGRAVFDVFKGEDLENEDDGNSVARPEEARLYHLVIDLPGDKRGVTLRFPFAGRAPVALFGLRFGRRKPR